MYLGSIDLCEVNVWLSIGVIFGFVFIVCKDINVYLNFSDKRCKYLIVINVMIYDVFKKEMFIKKSEIIKVWRKRKKNKIVFKGLS